MLYRIFSIGGFLGSLEESLLGGIVLGENTKDNFA
jgi:hypothetical protein